MIAGNDFDIDCANKVRSESEEDILTGIKYINSYIGKLDAVFFLFLFIIVTSYVDYGSNETGLHLVIAAGFFPAISELIKKRRFSNV